MIFRQFLDAVSHTYTYLLADQVGGQAILIDPVKTKLAVYQQLLMDLDLQLVFAIDTHTHADHITALGDLRDSTGCVTIMGVRSKADCVSRRVSEGESIHFGDQALRVLDTPGHTIESISLFLDTPCLRAVFTGDVLLIRGSGRTDFQAGDAGASWDSVTGKLFSLPDDTVVYPAHDYKGWGSSTIAEERRCNPRFAGQTRDSYIELMQNLNLPRPDMMDVAVPANLACGVGVEEPPKPLSLQLGFIGAGRLAGAVSRALQSAGVSISRVASQRPESAQALAEALGNCMAVDLQAVADQCDLVFITTPDAAISTVVNSVRWRAGQSVVHCSGATAVAVLQPAAEAGAQIGGFHPMQAFGVDTQAALTSLPGCTVAIEAAEPLDALLQDLAVRLGCVGLRLPPAARVRYHASGGFASQHLHVLLAEAIRLWQSWGATEQQALDALLPLMRGTLEALAGGGVIDGMAGPISRGDIGTVRLHRQALQVLDPDLRSLYDQLCLRGVLMLQQAGRLDPAAIQAMKQALHEPQP